MISGHKHKKKWNTVTNSGNKFGGKIRVLRQQRLKEEDGDILIIN